MSDPIAALSESQVLRAVKLFYDFAPPELWEDEERPSSERVQSIASALVSHAPPELKAGVKALVEDGQEPEQAAARAEVCRIILRHLHDTPAFQPYVDQAVAKAGQADMGIDPATGAFVIAFLLATTKIEDGRIRFGGGSVDMIKALQLPQLLHELPPVLKALPESVWNALLKLKGA